MVEKEKDDTHGIIKEGRKEMFYLTTHSAHFSYGYMVSGHNQCLCCLYNKKTNKKTRTPQIKTTSPPPPKKKKHHKTKQKTNTENK